MATSKAIIPLEPGGQAVLSPAARSAKETEAAQFVTLANAFEITNTEEQAKAAQLAQRALQEVASLEKMRKSATAPLNAAKKEIDNWFRPSRESYQNVADILKRAIGRYTVAQRALQTTVFQSACQLHAGGQQHEASQAMAQASAITTTAPAATTVREVWKAKVIDPLQVPRAFLVVDEAAINKIASATPASSTPANIPGVCFELEPFVSVRK